MPLRKRLALLAVVFCLQATAASPRAEEGDRMMTTYLVLLRKGPAWTPEVTPGTQAIQDAHMANIQAMWKAGHLIIAGPIDDATDDLRGILVFNAASLDEAKAFAASDPAVKARRLAATVYPWWVEKGALPDAGKYCTEPGAKH
jgi:uncharacterized protein YciI